MIYITEQEFKRIISLFSGTVFRTAMCYVKNKSDADDIMQDVFLKLYTYGGKFESDEHAKAWLIRVTANSCKNLIKSHWHRFRLPIEKAENIPAEQAEGDYLLSVIMKLGQKNRTVLYMHYYEGCSVKEIAELTGMTETAVTSQLYRGRKHLKQLLLKEGYDE
ncbi:MAG: sigma-70 family RNA polymerase sigma factor [Ruminiclostridium sp.]|nr:sigma-70 family RNA polymerase sigma factor [Ruminiclostridium sp.]